MPSFRRLLSNEPVGVFAVLWPVVLLAPLTPGLPKSWTGFSWRQELLTGVLLLITFLLLSRKFSSSRTASISFQRNDINIFWSLALFIVWSLASIGWSKGWLHTVHYILTWSAFLVCFLLMRSIAQRPRLLTGSLVSLALVVIVISVASAIEFWLTPPELYQFGLLLRRSTGLGEPLAVVVPIFVIVAISVKSERAALFFASAAILSWLSVLQTLERAPLLGLAASLPLMIIGFIAKKAWRPIYPRRALVLLTVLLATTAFQTVVPGASSAFHRFKDWQDHDPNTQVRVLVWAIGIEMFREHPIQGVGANNYEIAYPSARAEFSSRHPTSPLVGLQEELLAQRAHNEYVQILAELGLVGLGIFLTFCAALMWMAWRALRYSSNPLVLGAVCSLTTFAVSSGASSVSFRWFGGGLLFFFAATIVVNAAARAQPKPSVVTVTPILTRTAMGSGLAVALVLISGMGVLGIGSTLRGMALSPTGNIASQNSGPDDDRIERLFRTSLRLNPYDGSTNFEYGFWLEGKRRHSEAVQHLRFATEHGFNSSICFAYLARAEAASGNTVAAERTLAKAVNVYPASIFLRVRHAIALSEIGKSIDASNEYRSALATDKPAARGWRHLMCFGADSAYAAAKIDRGISSPEMLKPQSWTYPASAEQAARPPMSYPPDEDNPPRARLCDLENFLSNHILVKYLQ